LNRTAIKYGIFTGFAVLIYLTAFYLYDKPMFRNMGVIWTRLVIYFIGMFMAALVVHRQRGGNKIQSVEKGGKFNVHHRDNAEELPFRKMIGVPFLVFLIANAYYWFFFYWMMNVYDAELLEMHQQLTYEGELAFAKERENEEYLKRLRESKLSDYSPTLLSCFYQYCLGAMGGFILSLLIALGVRRS